MVRLDLSGKATSAVAALLEIEGCGLDRDGLDLGFGQQVLDHQHHGLVHREGDQFDAGGEGQQDRGVLRLRRRGDVTEGGVCGFQRVEDA
jgi:hypothetical protein